MLRGNYKYKGENDNPAYSHKVERVSKTKTSGKRLYQDRDLPAFKLFPKGMFLSLRIAFINLFRPNIVVRYPVERAYIPPRARWAVEINYAEDGTHRCTACKVCEKECPDYLIELDIDIAEDRSRHIKSWHYRQGGCMMCGLCVEACPFDAIKMGHDYELAHASPDHLEYDLLTDIAAYKRPRKERPTPPPKKEAADA